MSFTELLIIAVGLSMDAFAVSICKGLATGKTKARHMMIAGVWFGGFQALMPLLGYLLGSAFGKYIERFDHWIAFGLLVIIGGNMLKEAFGKEESCSDDDFGMRTMFLMAVATSIDALAVGVSFAILPDVNIWFAIGSIGIITCILSAVGIKIGSIFGNRYKKKAQIAGGLILVLMGCKILLEHMGVIGF